MSTNGAADLAQAAPQADSRVPAPVSGRRRTALVMKEAPGAGGRYRRTRKRLRLVYASDERVGDVFRAHVVLEGPDGGRYEGRAELSVNGQTYLRAACRATLAALRPLVGEAVEMDLIGVGRMCFEGGDVIVVQIASRVHGRPELLQGAAVAGDTPELDSARAVLHATNRLVGRFLKA